MYLMMRRVFDELGYRRYEWKCDSLNEPSRRAALRLGFTYEGIFRQAIIYRGRNRDTAWFSVTDKEWPALKRAYEAWLVAGELRWGREAEKAAGGPDRGGAGALKDNKFVTRKSRAATGGTHRIPRLQGSSGSSLFMGRRPTTARIARFPGSQCEVSHSKDKFP